MLMYRGGQLVVLPHGWRSNYRLLDDVALHAGSATAVRTPRRLSVTIVNVPVTKTKKKPPGKISDSPNGMRRTRD